MVSRFDIAFVLSLVGGMLVLITLGLYYSGGWLGAVAFLIILSSIALRLRPTEHVTWGSVIAVVSAGVFLIAISSYVSELDLAARYHWDPNGDTFVNTTRNLLFAASASLVGLSGGILGIISRFQNREPIKGEGESRHSG